MNNKKIDKTSLIMIILFVIIIAVAVIWLVLFKSDDVNNSANIIDSDAVKQAAGDEGSLTIEDIFKIIPDAQPGSSYSYFDDDGELKTITIPADYVKEEAKEKAPSKYKFEKFEDLSDKFLEVCKNGDVEELYHLYYDDFLEGMRLNMEDVPTKEEFNKGLRENMLTITGFDEYEYGCPELPPTQSPGAYASYIYSMVNNGEKFPIATNEIDNCVNLVVYIENMYQTNHFMVEIDGYWYFIV